MYFRKIRATDTKYIEMANRFNDYLNKFAEYAKFPKTSSSKTVSGKSASYRGYLIRLMIFIEEENQSSISELLSFETYKQIQNIRKKEGFGSYNKSEKGFPNASANCFIRFLNEIYAEIEEGLLSEEGYVESSPENHVKSTIQQISSQVRIITSVQKTAFFRQKSITDSAKRKANWLCEFSSSHTTFVSASNNLPYVEGHHLIPMYSQGAFSQSLDFKENIIALCPTCHKKIHFGTSSEKKVILSFFFDKRKLHYKDFKIEITLEELQSFYNIY